MSDKKQSQDRLSAHLTKLTTEPAVSSAYLRDVLVDILKELTDDKPKVIDGGTY